MITKEELMSVSYGVLRLEEMDGYWFLRRFTKAQEEVIVPRLDMRRNDSASMMRLEFTTCGGELSFDYSAVQTTGRNFCSFDIALDGVPVWHFEERCHTMKDSIAFTVPQSSQRVKVTVYFSCYNSIGLKNVCLPADFRPTNRQRNILFLGDSITHGSDASYPSQSYGNLVTDFFDARSLSQAIGGDYFLADNLDPNLPFIPNCVVVAYGTNDWSLGRLRDDTNARAYLDKLTAIYPTQPIFLLLPIWRQEETETRFGMTLQQVRDLLAALGKEYANVHVVDCKNFVPWLPAFFKDEKLHPNEMGYIHYANKVIRAMEEVL